VRPDLAEIWKAADRAASLTSQLLAFSRKQVIDPRVVDLNALIEDSTRMLKRLIGEDIELVFSPAPDLGRVRVDPHQLEQVLVNLVVNARDAMPNGGILSVATTNWTIDEAFAGGRPDCAPGEYVLLTVADSGVGMSPEVLERLFEPFFTTKSLGRGAGLGLSIVYGVIRQNNGFIDVESAPDAGTTFRIYLPLVSEMPDRREPEVLAAAPGGDETVLLVEDEEMVRNLARRVLERQGYRVVVAASGAEALRLFSERGAEIDLLLTDVVMPQMNGRELHEILKRSRPDLKAVFMSGYTEDVIARHGVIEPGMHFLQKPFSVDLLIRKVRGALDN
jgi:CheY-like chemotaxis protein